MAQTPQNIFEAALSRRNAPRRNQIDTGRLAALPASRRIGRKLFENKRAAIKIRTAMIQVEAVLQMLQPGFSVAAIAAKRRNKSNPWFKRGTLFRSAVDVLRRGPPLRRGRLRQRAGEQT